MRCIPGDDKVEGRIDYLIVIDLNSNKVLSIRENDHMVSCFQISLHCLCPGLFQSSQEFITL